MIYILSGIAKSGKSLVAKEFQQRHRLSIFSTDYIMMMLHKGKADIDLDILASDSSVAATIEPYVAGLISTLIELNDSYLIEGVHFNTDFAALLLKQYPSDIRILYLGYKDVTLEAKREELLRYQSVMTNPWLFHHPTDSLDDIIIYMIKESERIYQECLEHQLPYLDVYDIQQQMEEILSALVGPSQKK